MVTLTTRNSYNKAEGSDGLAAYLVGDLKDTIDDLDGNTAKCNFVAATNPAAGDDSVDGYSVGSWWVNLTDSKIFVCQVATASAAVWDQIYPAVAADLGTTLTEKGDIPYWGNSALAALHHSNKGYVLCSGGHGAIPYWDAIAQNGWAEADETWTYNTADDPTYTFTVSGDVTTKYYPGMRVKLTQTSVRYFLITAVTYAAPNSTVTVYGGTDYDLANAAITENYYSAAKAPLGFPLDPAKWSVTLTDESERSQASPSQNTWYNPGSLSIVLPLGAWTVFFKATAWVSWASAADRWAGVTCGLATATSSEPVHAFAFCANHAGTMQFVLGFGSITHTLVLAAKTTYHVAISTDSTNAASIAIDGLNRSSQTQVVATSSYL